MTGVCDLNTKELLFRCTFRLLFRIPSTEVFHDNMDVQGVTASYNSILPLTLTTSEEVS